MARLTKALTNTQVKQAKPKEKEFSLSDGDGLALRIKPNVINDDCRRPNGWRAKSIASLKQCHVNYCNERLTLLSGVRHVNPFSHIIPNANAMKEANLKSMYHILDHA